MLVLAGRQLCAAGALPGGDSALRPSLRTRQRRRPAVRRVRPRGKTLGRKLPAGVHACLPDQHGPQPDCPARSGGATQGAVIPGRVTAEQVGRMFEHADRPDLWGRQLTGRMCHVLPTNGGSSEPPKAPSGHHCVSVSLPEASTGGTSTSGASTGGESLFSSMNCDIGFGFATGIPSASTVAGPLTYAP